jgi:hypothetical protein
LYHILVLTAQRSVCVIIFKHKELLYHKDIFYNNLLTKGTDGQTNQQGGGFNKELNCNFRHFLGTGINMWGTKLGIIIL